MKKLPEELREELSKPFGPIISDKFIEELKAEKKSEEQLGIVEFLKLILSKGIKVSVGDVTSQNLCEIGLIPNIMIIDGKTKRGKFDEGYVFTKGRIKVDNPAGVITPLLESAIRSAIVSIEINPTKSICIFVTGEEDLAVIPAIIYLPYGSVVFYGQPNEGMVAFEIKQETKQKAIDIYNRMEESKGD